MPKDEYLHQQRKEASVALATDLAVAVGEAMTVHGKDPQQRLIVAVAFCLTIENIDKQIDPGFKEYMVKMLSVEE